MVDVCGGGIDIGGPEDHMPILPRLKQAANTGTPREKSKAWGSFSVHRPILQ